MAYLNQCVLKMLTYSKGACLPDISIGYLEGIDRKYG